MMVGSGTNRLLHVGREIGLGTISTYGVVIDLVKGVDLAVARQKLEFCWFPLSGLVSVIAADADANEAEVGVIGFEGMVNSGVLLGSTHSEMRLLVQLGGTALRVETRHVLAAARADNRTMQLLVAYDRALGIQATYAALAYARYPLAKRLARWLLMCSDRVGDKGIDLTHESLAIMLGVRRAGVTEALNKLVTLRAIEIRRSSMTVINRLRLIEIAGNGYGLAEEAYEHLVGG